MNNLVYKICNPTFETGFIETVNNQFIGTASPYIMQLINLANEKYNLSHFINSDYPGVGAKSSNSESYDGCIGRLQRGEADLMTRTFDYPVNIVNLTHGYVLYDERTTIVGVFTKPEASKIADFGRCIFSFNKSVYLMIALVLIVIALLLYFQHKLRRMFFDTITKFFRYSIQAQSGQRKNKAKFRRRIKKIQIPWIIVLRHYLRSNFIDAKTSFVKYCVILITIFSFITFAYFTSVIKTDYVLHGEVKLYKSYEELMNNSIKPLFLVGDDEMKNLPDSTPGKELWNWAVKNYGEDQIHISLSDKIQSLLNHDIDLVTGRSVIVVGEFIASFLKKTGCDVAGRSIRELLSRGELMTGKKFEYSPDYEEMQLYLRTDSSAPNKIKALPFSQSAGPLLPIFGRLYRIFYDHALFYYTSKMIFQIDIFSEEPFSVAVPKALSSKYQVKRICEEYNRPVYKSVDVYQLKLVNYRYCSLLCSSIVFISLVVLILENIFQFHA